MSLESEHLQRKLNLMHGEPVVPLVGIQAVRQAYALRMRGLSYRDLRLVMGIYHGEWTTAEGWRYRCRQMGAPVTKGPKKVLR